jgi:ATP-dependent RNA helicase DDX3X
MLIFSATFPCDIQMLAKDFLKDYIFLSVDCVGSTSENIIQKIESIEDQNKHLVLLDLLTFNQSRLMLVLVETKQMADMQSNFLLNNSFMATLIHGDHTQHECEMALQRFRQGYTSILVATAIAM